MISARTRRYRQSAVFPELSFGFKTKRRPDLRDEARHADKSETGYLAEPFEIFVFPSLPQHRQPGLFSQIDECIKLPEKELGGAWSKMLIFGMLAAESSVGFRQKLNY